MFWNKPKVKEVKGNTAEVRPTLVGDIYRTPVTPAIDVESFKQGHSSGFDLGQAVAFHALNTLVEKAVEKERERSRQVLENYKAREAKDLTEKACRLYDHLRESYSQALRTNSIKTNEIGAQLQVIEELVVAK